MADTARRISPAEAHQHLETGDALLICAYDDDKKCHDYHLPGAIHMNELRGKESSIPRDRLLIFY